MFIVFKSYPDQGVIASFRYNDGIIEGRIISIDQVEKSIAAFDDPPDTFHATYRNGEGIQLGACVPEADIERVKKLAAIAFKASEVKYDISCFNKALDMEVFDTVDACGEEQALEMAESLGCREGMNVEGTIYGAVRL